MLSSYLFFTSGLRLEGVPHEDWEAARYGFDSVLLAGKLLHLSDKTRPIGNQGCRHLLPLGGSYITLTDRAYRDVHQLKGSHHLGYDPEYRPGRYTLLEVEKGPRDLKWMEEATGLPEGNEHFFQKEPLLDFVAWCWRGKVMQVNFSRKRSLDHRFNDRDYVSTETLLGLTADGWANLVNPSYLTFRAWHAEQVRLAGGPDAPPDSA